MSYSQRFREIICHADALPVSVEKIASYEQAIKFADAHGNIHDGYLARKKILRPAIWSGEPNKAIIAYSWCLAQTDKQPDIFPEDEIMWEYKWIINHTVAFPCVSRTQIDNLLHDMQQRYLRNGGGERPVLEMRMSLAIRSGEFSQARELYQKWKFIERDRFSDCPACEQDTHVYAHLFAFNDFEMALKYAQPIFSGELSCASIPDYTVSYMLEPLIDNGYIERAREYYDKYAWSLDDSKHSLFCYSSYLRFAIIDQRRETPEKFVQLFNWALDSVDKENIFDFLIPAKYFLQQCLNKGTTNLNILLPANIKKIAGSDIASMLAWVNKNIQLIADEFDQRNGNSYYNFRLSAVEKLKNYREILARYKHETA